jgi:hypothetical protein
MTYLTFLAVRNFNVAPASVYHVALGQDPHLGLVAREPDEAEPLRLAGLYILLHLSKRLGKQHCLHGGSVAHPDPKPFLTPGSE